MNRSHPSDDQMIGLLYGLDEAAEHVAACPDCRSRLDAMQRARTETIPAAQIGPRELAEQRQQVLERLARPSASPVWRWVPAPAALALLAAALFLSRPASVPQPAPTPATAEADTTLFTDVYSMEQQVEPKAAAPIRALFQETAYEPEERQIQ